MNFNDWTIFRLAPGKHETPADGLCLMEAVAWMEGEPHFDAPRCACPIVGIYARRINDLLPDEWRQKLVGFIPRIAGTRSQQHERARGEYLAWQAVRVFAPLALDAANLPVWAEKLRAFDGTLGEAGELLYSAKGAAQAAAKRTFAAIISVAAAVATMAANTSYRPTNVAAAVAAIISSIEVTAGPTYEAMIGALAGVIEIGPSGKPLVGIENKVAAYRELVGV